tara:strand:- start:157 stop:522 length:366 start_codon:yes stop_codon:yes gene_type:complete
MNTVIAIEYKNYTENEIVTEENAFEIIELLLTDKTVIDFEYIVEGDINLNYELGFTDYLSDFKVPSKVLTIEKMYDKMEEIKEEFCFTKAEEERNNLKIEKLEKRAIDKTWDLKNTEKLFM